MPKKVGSSFSQLKKCKGCNKDLDKNSSDEILRLGLCPACYNEYIDMKRYVDKYVDEFEIDKDFDTSVDGLLNDYITEKNFEKIFFSEHKEQIYQYIREMISPPSSPPRRKSPESSDGESASSDIDSPREEIKQAELTRKDKKHQEYEALNRQHGERLKSIITPYCSASTKIAKSILSQMGFTYPTAGDISTCIDSVVYMYLYFKTYEWRTNEMVEDEIFKKYMNAGRPFLNLDVETGASMLPHTAPGTEYDAVPPTYPNFRGFFRFVRFQDGTVYFTRDHYLTFVNMETGEIIKSQQYLDKEEKKK